MIASIFSFVPVAVVPTAVAFHHADKVCPGCGRLGVSYTETKIVPHPHHDDEQRTRKRICFGKPLEGATVINMLSKGR